MKTLLLKVGPKNAQWWLQTMQSLLPELQCRLWDDPGNPTDVRYAAVWRPPPGGLANYWNLQAVFSIGAGVDHVLSDPDYPVSVPLYKTIAPDLTQRMIEYVLLQALYYHRRMPELAEQQVQSRWDQLISPLASDRSVGIMGLGAIGLEVARTLHRIGFSVRAWTRSQRNLEDIECYFGDAQLEVFLEKCEILICLLALTAATKEILNARLFDSLPQGAIVINVGRGEHLVEQDLLDALEQQQLAGATLDVFKQEPLPPEHPFWRHPKIKVTPHLASLIDPAVGSQVLAANIRRLLGGDPLNELRVDLTRGY